VSFFIISDFLIFISSFLFWQSAYIIALKPTYKEVKLTGNCDCNRIYLTAYENYKIFTFNAFDFGFDFEPVGFLSAKN
jgi:hypothetical protein